MDEHEHAHSHSHAHPHEHTQSQLLLALLVGALIMLVEIAGGLYANSLVLLADAAHYATDVAAIAIAYLAARLAARPATMQRTFGYKRAEVLAAFLNAAALWGLSAYFVYESYRRLRAPQEVAGGAVILVGILTLVANGALAMLLSRSSGKNLNVRAAYVHILSDVLGSAAAVVAGLLTLFAGWRLADPVLTLFITVLILVFTWRLTKETLHILLEGAPQHVDVAAVEAALRDHVAVREVHELHVWSLSSGTDVLSVHVVLEDAPVGDQVTHDIHRTLRERFAIDHVTVQVESPGCPCEMARCAPVTS